MSIDISEAAIRDAINDGIKKAAEPIIKAALADIERAMREKVGSIAVSMVSGQIDIFQREKKLVITLDINDNLRRQR